MILPLLLAAALTPEQKAVLAPVDAIFAAIAAHDGPAALAVLRPGGGATVATERPDGTRAVRRLSWEQLAAGMKPVPETFAETMPTPIVRIDGDIAMVWGRYVFAIDGKPHHCGVDHFDLVREDGQWRIANATWSSRTTGCGR